MNDEGWVSRTTVQYESGGTRHTVYGAMSFRYWFGTPGQSDLISGSVLFYEPIRVVDQEQFELDLKQQVKRRVETEIGLRTGLMFWDGHPHLDRIEWLWIWEAEPDTIERAEAFRGGWSSALPAGVRVQSLKSDDLGRLARRMGVLPGRNDAPRFRRVDPPTHQ